MRRSIVLVLSSLLASGVLLAGCGDVEPESDAGGTGSGDAASGEGVCATDPAYPPQSKYVPADDEYVGFDIEVATEIANRLGVDIGWTTPSWDVITSGGWNGRWDMSVGSMTPTNDRQQVLHFTEPYYFTPAVVAVHEDNTGVQNLQTDLDGKKIGVCSGCTYEQFLDKSLDIKGFEFDFAIDDAVVKGYDTDTTALQDLSLGDGTRLDAVITSSTTAQGYADEGNPIEIVGDPVFYEPLSVAMDKRAELDPATLVDAADEIVAEMHADGTLSKMSEKWYGLDVSKQQ